MPTVSLRLSVEELEALRGWARGSRRSLQREIVFRLFDDPLANRDVVRSVGVPSEPVVHDVPMRGCGFDTPKGTKCKLCGKVH